MSRGYFADMSDLKKHGGKVSTSIVDFVVYFSRVFDFPLCLISSNIQISYVVEIYFLVAPKVQYGFCVI